MKSYILLVEDDKFITEPMSYILRHDGYQVKIAGDLKTATRLFDKELPELILLDYIVPDGSDIKTFISHVREKSPVPMILITAVSNSEAIAEALEIKDLIKKPFNIEDLLNKVNHCLGRNCPPEKSLSL